MSDIQIIVKPTYNGLSSGSHPSSSLRQTKQRATSTESFALWKKPASAIWEQYKQSH